MGCCGSKADVSPSWEKSTHEKQGFQQTSSAHPISQGISDTLKDIDADDAERERAVVKIQSTFRGHRARRQLQHRNTAAVVSVVDLNDPELAEEAAATRIQATFRGHQVRRDGVRQQRQQDLYRQMEALHSTGRPDS